MPVRIVPNEPWNNFPSNGEHNIHGGACHEFHTGHLPKVQYAAKTGPLDRMETTPAPQQQIKLTEVRPVSHFPGLYEIQPPITHWVKRYTRVTNYHYNNNY